MTQPKTRFYGYPRKYNRSFQTENFFPNYDWNWAAENITINSSEKKVKARLEFNNQNAFVFSFILMRKMVFVVFSVDQCDSLNALHLISHRKGKFGRDE